MMDRRDFLKALAAAGVASGLGACATSDRKKKQSEGIEAVGAIERRPLGRTGEKLSVIGFGGIVVMEQTPAEAANYVAQAFERGINYFDVAPAYGNAEERLGPALKPYRDRVFLACKTGKRTAKEAEEELNRSLKLFQTDHFDLYQLHAITSQEDIDKAFGPGGAMELFERARQQGKVRFLGFSAHSEMAALAAMERFKFDTILYPFNLFSWHEKGFGPKVLEAAQARGMGILALKALAYQEWPKNVKKKDRKWSKCWYEPMEKPEEVALGLRFTLNLPVCAALPPGHWELFKMALDAAEAGPLKPFSAEEERILKQMAAFNAHPVFPRPDQA